MNENNELIAIFSLKKDLLSKIRDDVKKLIPQADSNSQIPDESNITIKIKLEKDEFMINEEVFKYEEDIGNLITELVNKLKNINLKTNLDKKRSIRLINLLL